LPDLADDNEDWDEIYTEIARQLIENEDLNTDAVYRKTATQLVEAMNKGFEEASFDDEDSRKSMQSKFTQNINQFSYAKTLTQFQLFKEYVFNNKGQLNSFEAVKKRVADTGEIFNNNYLRAETQFVTQSAIMAHKWETLDSEYLEFTTVGDNRVRPEHKIFDKFTALKTDPIWKRLYTPLSWGCRCTVIPGKATNVSKEYDSEWANKMVDPLVKGTIFDNNAALTGKIFTDKHPYFKVKKTNTGLEKEVLINDFKLDDANLELLKNRGFDFRYYDIEGKNIWNENFSKFNILQLDSEMLDLAKKYGSLFNKKEISFGEDAIHIEYRDTKKGISIERKFSIDEGFRAVKHAYFELPKEMQGQGFSKDMFKIFHKQYLNADIEKIKVHANIDVGGYTWAKYGFKPTRLNDMVDINRKANRLFENGELTKEHHQDFMMRYNNSENGLLNLKEVSDLEYGKILLLKTDWFGELNLKDKGQRKIYEDYLFGKK
jgi:hypothetical protein